MPKGKLGGADDGLRQKDKFSFTFLEYVSYKYTVEEIEKMEGKIIDTRMSDLRIYTGKCPTLRAHRDGILYVKGGSIYNLTGYEALLLQGFPKEYADKVKDKVTDRHLLMQAGNAMTVDVVRVLGQSIMNFMKLQEKK